MMSVSLVTGRLRLPGPLHVAAQQGDLQGQHQPAQAESCVQTGGETARLPGHHLHLRPALRPPPLHRHTRGVSHRGAEL